MSGEDFEILRQQTTDFARLYREGRSVEWQPARRRRAWQKLQLPRQGVWTDEHRRGRFVNAHPDQFGDLHPYRLRGMSGSGPLHDRAREESAIGEFISDLDVYGLKFKKILGWGGLGAAALFDLRDRNGNLLREVVVKCDLQPDTALVVFEKAYLQVGSSYIRASVYPTCISPPAAAHGLNERFALVAKTRGPMLGSCFLGFSPGKAYCSARAGLLPRV